MAEPADNLPEPSRLGRWLASQVNNLDAPRREAAAHIASRWDVLYPTFRMARIVRTLRREESPHLLGALQLAQDYTEAFGEVALAEVGPVGAVQFDIVTCVQCRREAVPGSDRCGRHGGQFLSPEDAKRISEHTASRVLEMTDKATSVIWDLLDNARSEKVRLEAANSVLDRAGITSAQRLEIEINSGVDAAELLRTRLDQMRGSMAKVEEIESSRMDAVTAAELDAEIVEAEVEE